MLGPLKLIRLVGGSAPHTVQPPQRGRHRKHPLNHSDRWTPKSLLGKDGHR